jgi:hypothetical protein
MKERIMRLVEESGFDASTKAVLSKACQAAFELIVREHPRFSWNSRLLWLVQHAVLDKASSGERAHDVLVEFAVEQGREMIAPQRLRRAS